MADETISEQFENWFSIGQQIFAGARDGYLRSGVTNAAVDVFATTIGKILGAAYVVMAPIGVGFATAMSNAEDEIAPAFANWAARGINDVFGTSISEAEFSRPSGRGKSSAAGDALGRALMAQLTGTAGALQPTDAPAAKFVSAFAGNALEDWFRGWMFEVMSSLIPQLDIGKIEAYGALGDKVANVLGLGGVSRRVLRPIVDTTIVTPLEWHINRTYRPRLLSAPEVVRQVLRGTLPREQGIEELARQGYSDRRIDALFNSGRKFLGTSEVRTLQYFNHWTNEETLAYLRDQGWDLDGAQSVLRVEGLRRNAAFEDAAASLIVNAYGARDISSVEFRGLLGDTVTNQAERNFAELLGELRRGLNVRRISSGQVRAAVLQGILATVDYRRALEREGYPDEDVIVFELMLRKEINDRANAAELRAELELERAAERKAAELAKRLRAEELERERAEAKRGPVGALEQAAIRGLVPIARVLEVYAADYDPDAVDILAELLETKRAAYVANEQKGAAAEQRAARRGLSVGQYRAAVRAGALSIEEFAAVLTREGLAEPDVTILVSTLRAELAARAAAEATRRQAAERAAKRRIDLGRYERLVRLGVRTIGQYSSLLTELGFDEASIIDLRALLEATIAADAQAKAARELADEARAAHGATPSQYLRGVALGVVSIAEYERYLIAEGFTGDAQMLMLAEARQVLADAEDARRRRERAALDDSARALPLATIRRAARLGVIAPDAYLERLRAAGYSEDDAAIDFELLLAEIADAQAKRAARELAESAAAAKGVPLGALARGVKLGTATLEQYSTRLAELGYTAAAAGELLELLEAELGAAQDAMDRRAVIAAEFAARGEDLAALEGRVLDAGATFEWFAGELLARGYSAEDADFLIARLDTLLAAAGDGAV